MSPRLEIALGPLLFHWSPERLTDFYARIADEAPVDRVYLGEVVCGKRSPLIERALVGAEARLAQAGKTVVRSGLALPATPREVTAGARRLDHGALVEINDLAALAQLPPGATFVAGPFLNIYNEAAAAELTRRGCVRLCGNVELPLRSIAAIAAGCPGLEIELFAYGRLPLAHSGRCHHAHAAGLQKDACQFACGADPDGLAVRTVEGEPFLAINGVQLVSYAVQAVDLAVSELRAAGVRALRLSPQSADMVAVAQAFRRFADGGIEEAGLRAALIEAGAPGPLVNGYLAGEAGMRHVRPSLAAGD